MIDAILWALSDGGGWRNIAVEFGPWQTVYDRFRKWCRSGLWDKILRHVQARKMHTGEIDWELFCIDGSVVRAHQSAAGASEKNPPPQRTRFLQSEGWFVQRFWNTEVYEELDAVKEAIYQRCLRRTTK
jgi:hypothetical protein